MPNYKKKLRVEITADDPTEGDPTEGDPRGEKTTPMSPEEIQDIEEKSRQFDEGMLNIQEEMGVGDPMKDKPSYSALEVLLEHEWVTGPQANIEKEILLSDNDNNLFVIYVDPQHNIRVDPVVMVPTRQPGSVTYPFDENFRETWGQIEKDIFPGGFFELEQAKDGKAQASVVRTSAKVNWKEVVKKIIRGHSFRKHYIEKVSKNPYLAK